MLTIQPTLLSIALLARGQPFPLQPRMTYATLTIRCLIAASIEFENWCSCILFVTAIGG